MKILDNFIILAIHVICFISGMRLADKYHKEAQEHEQYALRLQQARKLAGDDTAYVAPPYRRRKQIIGQPFLDKLKDEGQAIQQISPEKPIA